MKIFGKEWEYYLESGNDQGECRAEVTTDSRF